MSNYGIKVSGRMEPPIVIERTDDEQITFQLSIDAEIWSNIEIEPDGTLKLNIPEGKIKELSEKVDELSNKSSQSILDF